MQKIILLGSAALSLIAPTAYANVLWKGDFSTGDLTQWDSPQSASPSGKSWDPSRLSVTTAQHPPDAAHALQVVLNAGDIAYNHNHSPPVYMGSRSEVTHAPQLGENDDRWYRWEVYFPGSYQQNDGAGGGAVFTQWHHYSPSQGEPGSPPLLFSALTNEVELVHVPSLNSQNPEVLWSAPMEKDRWHTFICHIHFSSDPHKGLIEVIYDGQTVLSKNTNTLFPGFTDYLKVGLYHRPNTTPNATIFLANVVEATSQADLQPPGAPQASNAMAAPSTGQPARTQVPASATSEAHLTTASAHAGCTTAGSAGLLSLLLLPSLARRGVRVRS